jgi:hypothetical protein
MGLDLWFQADVARILASTQETMAATMSAAPALDPDQAEAYKQGFSAAIRAVAVAFGVAGPTLPGGNGNRPTRSVQVIEADPHPLRGW